MDTDTIMNWLKGVPFFLNFTDDELKILAKEHKHFMKFNSKEMIIQEGQTDRSLFIILTGSVIATKSIHDKEVTLTKLNQGTIFGEMSLLRKGRRTSNIITETPTVVMTIKPDDLENLNYHLQSKFKDQLLKLVLSRFEALNDKYTALVNKPSI